MNTVRPQLEALRDEIKAFEVDLKSQYKNLNAKDKELSTIRNAINAEERKIPRRFNNYKSILRNTEDEVRRYPTTENQLKFLNKYAPKSGLFTSKNQRIKNGIKAVTNLRFEAITKEKNNATRRRGKMKENRAKHSANFHNLQSQIVTRKKSVVASHGPTFFELCNKLKTFFPPQNDAEKNIIYDIVARFNTFVTGPLYDTNLQNYLDNLKVEYNTSVAPPAPNAVPRPAPPLEEELPEEELEEEVTEEELEELLGGLKNQYRQGRRNGLYVNLKDFADAKGLNQYTLAILAEYIQPQRTRGRRRGVNSLQGNPGYSRRNQGF
jgi:hypothetical protein